MQRQSGILLHPTALPNRLPIGDIGPDALRFVDFLAESGQQVWQVLPLGPTGYGHSPYNALSAFAGNPALISLESLVACGDLRRAELDSAPANSVDFDAAHAIRAALLESAARRFFSRPHSPRHDDYQRFCSEHALWLDDFALFSALRKACDVKPWTAWPKPLRQRQAQALSEAQRHHTDSCRTVCYQQFIFDAQWRALKAYANSKGVRIFGDLPIFVAADSADVWARQELFRLDAEGRPTVVAGVPPDYFSRTGQRWGNPLYRWQRHIADNFNWWLQRFARQAELSDLLRIDHFRGFEACWTIPAGADTAEQGCWQKSPGRELFTCLSRELPQLQIVAEDLGSITPEVERLRDDFGFPGMKILQFAFDSGPDNPYLPANHTRNSVVYTGTHDNDTTLGWWRKLDREQRETVREQLGDKRPEMPWQLIRLAMQSVANLCIIPCQDLLGLGSEARFNRPGRATGNWRWQLSSGQLTDQLTGRLAKLSRKNGRCG
jgi:4-alpha-glucanotransferase